MSGEYKASIPLRACRLGWLAWVLCLPLVFLTNHDWPLYVLLGFFAVWEAYGIVTPRPLDTLSEQVFGLLKGAPARRGLAYGLVGFLSLSLVRMAWTLVYGEDGEAVAKALKFWSAVAFVVPATIWLGIHFRERGRLG